MEENGITVSYRDPDKLKYFTIQVEALFECHKVNCGNAWSSHMATIEIDLLECKVNRSDCEQRCKKCPAKSWICPKLTEDRFREAVDRVIVEYWKRKNKNDEDDDGSRPIDNNRYRGNSRSPHEQSLCKRCMKLGAPCW